jgi:hydrogenase maturation protease
VRADDPQLRPLHLLRDALPEARGRAALRAGVVCLGSPFRGDDALGPAVAGRLGETGAALLHCDEEPTRLLDRWAGLDLVVIVDAIRSGAEPGTLHRVEASDGPLPRDLGLTSTHAFGILDAVELGRALGRAPARVVVLGLEGEQFGFGEELSPAVAARLDDLVAAVRTELDG